jgi:hypothetical protein
VSLRLNACYIKNNFVVFYLESEGYIRVVIIAMKKSKLIFLTTLIMLIKAASIHAQIAYFNYVPLEFKDKEPLWIHVTSDSTMIGAETDESTATYDGHSHVHNSHYTEDDYIVHEGYLYVISGAIYDNDLSGAIIEKVDINTGDLIWKTVFDGRTLDYREHVERTIIRDNKLVLYTYLITQADPEEFPVPIVFFGWAEGILKVREYDIDTGELLSETSPDVDDPASKKIRDYKWDISQLHIINEDSLLFYKRYWDTIGSFFVIDTLSTIGKALNDPDTIWSELVIDDWGDSYWSSDFGIRRDSDGYTYWLDYYVPGDFTLDTAQANINIYKKGALVDSISLGFIDKSNIQRWHLRNVTDEYFYIQVQYFNNQGSRHLFLNKGGEIIQDVYNPLNERFFVKLDEDQKFIIADQSSKVGDNYEFSFFQNSDGVLRSISSMTVGIPNYKIEIAHIQELDDGSYLVAGNYYKVEGFSSKGTARFMMKLSEEMIMGETVSTADITGKDLGLALYPNPTSGILHLEFEKWSDTRVRIYNVQGVEVYSQEFFSDKVDVDLGYLECGVYTVVVSIEGQLVRRKIVRI